MKQLRKENCAQYFCDGTGYVKDEENQFAANCHRLLWRLDASKYLYISVPEKIFFCPFPYSSVVKLVNCDNLLSSDKLTKQ